MKKMIFRISKSKAYVHFFDLKDKIYDYYGSELDTTIFFVFYPSHSEFL